MILRYKKQIKQTYVKIGLRAVNISVERGTEFDDEKMEPYVMEGLLATGDFELIEKPSAPINSVKKTKEKDKE